ncbi:helix-turn-helix domain-containing protein [Endothiovibrio diazotrophicus]
MIRFRLKELVADREFREGRRVTLDEVAQATGIGRNTLTRIAGNRGHSTTTDTLDKLCDYFGCRIEQLVEHVPRSERSSEQE